MFDETIRALKRLEEPQKVSVTVECHADADGYIDKECPNEDCAFEFKVHAQDWRDKVRDEEVFCPFCGKRDSSENWFTTGQVEWAKKKVFEQVLGAFDTAMERDSASWNASQPSNSFIKMTMNYNRGEREVLLPVGATDPMRLKIDCPQCGCRYAVIGSAYFCPACGHNAADRMFGQSLDKIIAALDALSLVRAAIDDRDTAENTVRSLIENGLQQAVTAFQRLSEAMWEKVPAAPKARRNAFQNLAEGSELWETVLQKAYSAYLEPDELGRLGRYFQQRHILAHREGLVDEDYIRKSSDAAYRPGQRLVVREDGVRDCLTLVRKLGVGLQADATDKRGA